MRSLIWLLISSVIFPGTLFAEQIYKATDDQGVVTFSDAPMPNMKDQQTININIPSDNAHTRSEHVSDKQTIANVPLTSDAIDAINGVKPSNKKELQRQATKKGIQEAFQNVTRSKRLLKEKIAAWQIEVNKLNNILPGQQQAVDVQQIKVDMAKQAVQDAKMDITNAEKLLELAKSQHINS